MVYGKQHVLRVALASIISVGIVLLVQSLLLTSHPIFAQVNAGSNMGMMNGGSNASDNAMNMNNMPLQSGMNTGSMNTNMTMDQMLDMMDMMHSMMMHMMRMMVHGGVMKTGNMSGNMTAMAGMQ
jgi:hypothetical protein